MFADAKGFWSTSGLRPLGRSTYAHTRAAAVKSRCVGPGLPFGAQSPVWNPGISLFAIGEP